MEFSESPNEEIIKNESSEGGNKTSDSSSTKNSCIKAAIITIVVLVILAAGVALIILFSRTENNSGDEGDKDKGNNPNLIRLKNWETASTKIITLKGEELSLGKTQKEFIKAPKDDYVCTAMSAIVANMKEDIFYERNLEKIDSNQFDDDWWFKSYFDLKSIDKKNNLIILHVNGINYKSDIFLDGHQISSQNDTTGTFIKFSIDITNYLSNSEKHFIAFKIKRPHNKVFDKTDKELDLAITFVDWNPSPPDSNMGIWQPVEVEIIKKKIPTVSSGFVITKLDKNNTEAKVDVVFHAKNWEDKDFEGEVELTLGEYVKCEIKDIKLLANEEKQIVIDQKICNELKIKNPKLWWPYQMGSPTLHKMEIKLFKKEDKSVFYSYQKKIGLREVSSKLSKDEKVRVYSINGQKILLKGAGWTPDIFLRQKPETYLQHIEYTLHMELNVIRLEGKSEGEEFYDMCDERGMLLIYGWCCCDAWQKWSLWSKEVRKIGKKSTRSQIRKLSPHPSVIIFIEGSDLPPIEEVETEWNELFDEELWPNEILSSANSEKSKVSGNTGVKMTGPYSWVPPNYYTDDVDERLGGVWGFLTEGGPGENPLNKGSYEKIFGKDSIDWPLPDTWDYHCGGKEGLFHDLSKFIDPLIERYGNVSDFDDFQKKSIASVYEAHRALFETYSYNKYRSSGVIQWMLNNAWPSNIWHLYDYFMAPTSAYFTARKAGERVHAIYGYKDSYIYLLNNYYEDFPKNSVTINSFVYSGKYGGAAMFNNSTKCGVKADSVEKVTQINIEDIDEDLVVIHLEYSYTYKSKKYFKTNTYWISKEMDKIDYSNCTFYNCKVNKYADLSDLNDIPKTKIIINDLKQETISSEERKKEQFSFKVKNEGETIALLIELKLVNKNGEMITPIFWDDNYFSVRSGVEQDVTVWYYADDVKNKDEMSLVVSGWNVDEFKNKIKS